MATQTVPLPGLGCLNSKEKGRISPAKPVEFLWDQLVLVLAVFIVSLSGVDTALQFFRGTYIQCTSENGGLTQDQVTYANGYCYANSVPWMGKSASFLLFTAIQSTLVVGLHILWSVLVEEDLRHFYDAVNQLDLFRNPKSGKYVERNIHILKYLLYTLEGRRWCIGLYVAKLLLQMAIHLIFMAVYSVASFFTDQRKLETFTCPPSAHDMWPLPISVTCYHASLDFLSIVQWTYIATSYLSVVAIIGGMVWLFLSKHTYKLCYSDMAAFAIESNLLPEHYFLQRKPAIAINYSWTTIYALYMSGEYIAEFKTWIRYLSQYWDDVKFLTIKLFWGNTDHGYSLREMLVQMEMTPEAVTKYYQTQKPASTSLRTTLSMLWRSMTAHPGSSDSAFLPDDSSVWGIMFGTTSLAHMLQYRFHSGASQFVNFDFYLREDSQPLRERTTPGHYVLLLPVAGLAVKTIELKKSLDANYSRILYMANLVVIGPLHNDTQCNTVDDLLGQFLQQTRVDEPVVLTISPLEIGGNDVRNFFPAFRPWSELSMSVLEKQELSEVPQNFECQENGTYLVTTECADVTCKFEFVFYVVNGKKKRRFLKKQRQQSQERQRQQVLEELQGQVLEWQRQQFLERQRQQVLEEQEVKNLEEQGQEENITP